MVYSLRRAIAIAKKETFHILRDPYTLAMALGLPVFMVIIYGLAIDFSVKNIQMAVTDQDQSQTSRRLVDTFTSSHYFVAKNAATPKNALDQVASEQAKSTLFIPPGFEKDLMNGRQAKAQVLLDGADGSTVGPAAAYVVNIEQMASKRLAGFEVPSSVEMRTRYLFNPELNSKWFVIPGLVVVVMAILSVLLTALTVSREWENGSMELLLSTPVQPLEIITGKLAPYGALGMIAVAFIFVIARFFFGVPFVGNIFVFGLGCGLFLVTYLAQGLLISVVTRNQQAAMQLAIMTGFLPSQLLSGFIFPIASMPVFFHYFTAVFPARWFMAISRAIFLKGSSLTQLAGPFSALLLICLFMVFRATSLFKRDLEK